MQPAKVTSVVLEHVERAGDAIKTFHTDGVTAEGVLAHPQFQAAALKVARQELQKAIALKSGRGGRRIGDEAAPWTFAATKKEGE